MEVSPILLIITWVHLFFAAKDSQILMHHFDRLCLVCWREKWRIDKKVCFNR